MTKSYTRRNISTAFALLTGSLVTLAGCGGGSDGGGGTGAVSLSVIDAPVDDAVKVCITFDTVEFKGDSGLTTVTLDEPEKINLLDFQGDNTAPLLVDQELPAGNYQWIRLGVDATEGNNGGTGDSGDPEVCDGEGSYIVMNDGGVYNLYVPSGAQSGLKLNRGFNVPANGQIYLTADFDLRQSITAAPGQAPDVKLRPTIRLVEINDAGTLAGTVAVERATAENCAPAVFVFNDGVTPNAIETGDVPDSNDPVATATVQDISITQDMSAYGYKVGFLLEGDYEVAFTCDGETFEPVEGTPATIVAKETTTVDFL
jgi:Domain of unknown function (DUF4382)